MSQVGRRDFLKYSLMSSGTAGIFESFSRFAIAADKKATRIDEKLVPVVDETTGLPLLRLPEGFSYRSFGWTGDGTLCFCCFDATGLG